MFGFRELEAKYSIVHIGSGLLGILVTENENHHTKYCLILFAHYDYDTTPPKTKPSNIEIIVRSIA